MEEGTFAGWLVPHGSPVAVGQPIYSLESDKVTMDVEALDAGILHIPTDAPIAGATVVVGQLLGQLLQANVLQPTQSTIDVEALNEGPTHISASTTVVVGRPLCHALRANVLQPTEDTLDVEALDAGTPHIPADALFDDAPVIVEASPRSRATAKALGIDIATVTPREGAPRIIEADVLRLTEGAFYAPQLYLHADADATALASLPASVSVDDILIKAVAMALQQHPRLNSHRTQIHIGLAVEANDRLLIPVIRNADQKSLTDIATERCRQHEAKRDALDDGSVTVMNLGTYGLDRFQAVLNPRQSAVLAVGRIAQRPVVVDGAVVARLTVPLSLTVDPRVADGLAAARFLRTIVQLVEGPLALIQ